MVRIRRTSVLLLPLALSAAALPAAAPAASAAPVKQPVTIVVNTTFDPDVADWFTGNVPGCGSGVVEDAAGLAFKVAETQQPKPKVAPKRNQPSLPGAKTKPHRIDPEAAALDTWKALERKHGVA